MPNDFGIPEVDNILLEDLAKAEGQDVMSMLEEATYDSIAPGICTGCKSTQECEPDARANYCHECGESLVRSCLDIAGII